jgi:bacteriocin biosynthesis cyclodehydratase domain-containing protein
VMHLLTGLSRPSTQGVAHMYDLRTMELKRERVLPEPECPICGEMPHEPIVEEWAGG